MMRDEDVRAGVGFVGVRVNFRLGLDEDELWISAPPDISDSTLATLRSLVMILTGKDLEAYSVGTKYIIQLAGYCIWSHQARMHEKLQTSQDVVYIVHPEDPNSLLILRNTEKWLHVIPQGRWEERSDEIRQLAGIWTAQNMTSIITKTQEILRGGGDQ